MPSQKQEKPNYLAFTSPEGPGYIAWEDDPLYQLAATVEEMGFIPEEVILPLKVLLFPDTNLLAIIDDHRHQRKQLIRQIHEYGSKLGVQETSSLINRLRSLVLQDFLLRKLYDSNP